MMRTKKPIFIAGFLMLIMLIVGMVLGGAIVGAVVRDRLENLRTAQTPEGFQVYMEQAIKPESEEQRQKLQPSFLKAGKIIAVKLRENRQIIKQEMDLLEAELEAILTPEQMAEWREKRRQVRSRLTGTK